MSMRPTVLIVEDEPAIAANIEYTLRTDGFDVVHVWLGNQAIQFLAAQTINAVVLDVGLPDINGFESCKQIRRTSQVPVLFVTARNDEIDRIVGLEIGADDYVVKPFSPRELVARIRNILRRTERATPTSPQTCTRVGHARLKQLARHTSQRCTSIQRATASLTTADRASSGPRTLSASARALDLSLQPGLA